MPEIISTSVQYYAVTERENGQRIDNFLLRFWKNVPKSHLYRLLRTGQIRVDGKRAKPELKLALGQTLRLPPIILEANDKPKRPPDSLLLELKNSILHEDEDVIALNKPAGLSAHSGTGVPYGVIEGLRALFEQPELELAHRLDRETSGILLIARRRVVVDALHNAMRERTAYKRYRVLLNQNWDFNKNIKEIFLPLSRDHLIGGERMVRIDHENGKTAHTRFILQENLGKTACAVQAEIMTGRTHQIRVHAQSLRQAVLGDVKYGDRTANQRLRQAGHTRMFLHSECLEIAANGKTYRFEAPLNAEWHAGVDFLRRG